MSIEVKGDDMPEVELRVQARGFERAAALFAKKAECGYVGLYNQGATCYLNSLLQSLYLTPEFRQSLFSWKYDAKVHGDESECIPRQLQALFARLALTSRGAVDTRDLTRSFCWTQADAFKQHDVQELMRVLFTALEENLSPSVINDIYQGKLIDWLECSQCSYRREREDTYLDVALDVKDAKTLEEALQNFVKPETLTDSNRYNCPKCATKVDAQKGLSFVQHPPVLCVTLKRFQFDFGLFQRVKINSTLSFGEELNMAPFLKAGSGPGSEGSDGDSDLTYDLFAVLMHSGTAMGGHYYAYVRPARGKEWLEFNDANVRPAPEWSMQQAYGGEKNGAARGGRALVGTPLP